MPIRNFPFFIDATDQISRPWLPIKIINPHSGQTLKFMGLLDTGADECAIPANFADILGHSLTKGKRRKVTAAGGPAFAYSHTTQIEIYNFSNKLCYTINDTPIDFMPKLETVLLGVKQFLEIFDLRISYPDRRFSITFPKSLIKNKI